MKALIFTCEHAAARVPARYRPCFAGAEPALAGHRGHDLGAAWLARRLARRFDAPLFRGAVSRLVVDLNRSPHHRALFSEYTRALPRDERARILARYYHPHRRAVEAAIRARGGGGRRVVHIAVHSFTPVLAGEAREADLGLLYDPQRPGERAWCAAWQRRLRAADPGLRVRRNYPYRGVADGFPTALRRRFDDAHYLGIELEVSQRWLATPSVERRRLADLVADSLADLVA